MIKPRGLAHSDLSGADLARQPTRITRPSAGWPGLCAVLIGMLALVAYGLTLSPGLLGGDAGEMQLVPPLLSLAHPTGYPLQTLLGKAWVELFRVGSVAFRLNLLSAIAGAVAVSLLFLTGLQLTRSIVSAGIAALAFGASNIYWSQAISADKYALTGTLTAAVLLAFASWLQHKSINRLWVSAFVFGLSLTHHRSLIVFGPLLGLYWAGWLWRSRRQLNLVWAGLGALVAFGLPLLLYAYLPVGQSRSATLGLPPNLWHPHSLADWWVYLSDAQFVSAVRPEANLIGNLTTYAATLLAQFGGLGLAMGVAGLLSQIIQRKTIWPFLLMGFVAQVVLTSGYQVFRNWVFFIPSLVLFSIWIGEGVAAVACGLPRLVSHPRPRIKQAMVASVSILLSIGILLPLLLSQYPQFRADHLDGGPFDLYRNDLKHGYQAQRFVANSLPWVDRNAIILADWEQATPLWYAQFIAGQRRDVQVFFPLELLTQQLAEKNAVYIGRTYPSLGDAYRYSAEGALLRVTTRPNFAMPREMVRPVTPTVWAGQIKLLGHRFHQTDAALGRVLPVSLFFSAVRVPAANYALSVRLYDAAGRQVWQEDRQAFALGMYASSRWQPGEVVGDYFEARLPVDSAGPYRIGIILYDLATPGEASNLKLDGSGDSVFSLPPLSID